MDTSNELLEDDAVLKGIQDEKMEEEEPVVDENAPRCRHVLEIVSGGGGEGNEQMMGLVHATVYEQLKSWGVDFESPTTRGRTKVRKSSAAKGAKSEVGQHRPVPVTLKRLQITLKVPIILKECCEFLRTHLSTEGIFRKSGSASRVQILMQRFTCLEKQGNFQFTASDTVFDVATVLKQYLREMEAPLIPYDIHHVFRKCLDVAPESSREEAIVLSSCLLPEYNANLLTYLIEFLMEVVEKKDENRMSFENLAIVIGPNIMPVEIKKTDKAKELEHERKSIDAHTRIVETLIRNGEKLCCLPEELQKRVESDFSVRGSEDELENDGLSRRKKRRSGSLTRVLGFLKKVTSKTGDTPVAQTPVDFCEFSHTPVMKSGKRRCLDENIFSLQKKKTILDGIRKNGLLMMKDDDKRYSQLTDTPNSMSGFITCPSPVCLNPSPMMKMDWKQTPNAGRFKNLVTPSLLRRKEKNGDSKHNTPFSAPSKPVKAKILGKKSKNKTPIAVPAVVLADNNGTRNGSGSVKRMASTMSIHKLANSPRKVARASSTRIPRPEKMNTVRKSNSSCRFPVAASPRDIRIGTTIPEKLSHNLSGEYVRLSPSAQIRDEKNEAFIASKISCLEDTVDLQQENCDSTLRLTPLIQEINTLTLTAQQELTLSGLRRKRHVRPTILERSASSVERPPPVPSRSTRRRSSGASANKAKLQSPPDTKEGLRNSSVNSNQSNSVRRSESIRLVEDKFKRALNETKIMRIQSERSAQVHSRAVSIHRRFSIQDKGCSPSQRRIISNASRRRSHELNKQPAGLKTPIDDLSRYGFENDSISRSSPNRCTLKRGRPNTLRSGLARPSPVATARNTSVTNRSRHDSDKENPQGPDVIDLRRTSDGDAYMPTPMRRMSSVQELVKQMEKGQKGSKKTTSDSSLKPVNRTEPQGIQRPLSRRNSSVTSFVKPMPPAITQKVIDVSTPKINRKRVNPHADCKTAPSSTNIGVEAWVPASDFNFETHRNKFMSRLNGHNEDRDSIQALKALNAGKVSENVRLFDGLNVRRSPGKSMIPRYVGLQKHESFSKK